LVFKGGFYLFFYSFVVIISLLLLVLSFPLKEKRIETGEGARDDGQDSMKKKRDLPLLSQKILS